jgi:hypothetical protein
MAMKAIRLGADELEVEYKHPCEEVFALKSGFGVGIASLRGSSRRAAALRRELYTLAKKKRRVIIDSFTYELRARIYDSFGENAFRVMLRRILSTAK